MVDSICIEILVHLAESLLPPSESRLGHLVPVIGRETPVLPVLGEGIRRCPSLGIKIVELRSAPCVGACTAYAYRKVSLQDNTLFMGILDRLFQLDIQEILLEDIEINFVPMSLMIRFYKAGRELRFLAPCREIGSPFLIFQSRENGKRKQPVLVGVNEGLALISF